MEAAPYHGFIELNLSCPNLPGKPQVGYDFKAVKRILGKLFSITNKPLGVKLPPYFDKAHFDKFAKILNQYPISFVNTINSIGNGLVIEDETVAVKPKNGFGGIGGQVVKATALANVHALYRRLNPEIDIIGTGGVFSGKDVFEHILCGAKMVQIGTALQEEGVKVFVRIATELLDLMEEKGYQTIEDFREKLKYL